MSGSYIDLTPIMREINAVGRQVVQVDRQVVAVNEKVVAVGIEQQHTRSELAQLRHDFLQFAERAQRIANIQRAETKIGVLQDEVEHQFGHHKEVRRTAVGILQAFDIGLVTDEVVSTVSQELMVQTPRYWLAPALVALASWTGDDRDLCERAVQEAFRRSPERTALFFALILRRQDRHDSAVRWLRHYLGTQDPTGLGREFAVVLEAISQGAFGPAGVELVQSVLERWRAQLVRDEGVVQAQVRRWRAEVEAHSGPSRSGDFPRLAAISPQWAQLDECLGRASAHRQLVEKYTAMFATEITPSDRVEDAVDDILDRLVNEYDTEELPHRRELAYQRNIVEHEGDLQAARTATDADSASLETKIDYLALQSAAALSPATIGVSAATQRVAVASCQEWFSAAHAQFTRDYLAVLPQDVQARFTGNHNLGATVFQLPEWVGSFRAMRLPQLEASLAQHWDRHVEPFLAKLVYNWQRAAIAPAVVCVLVLVLLASASLPFALIAALVVGAAWGLIIYNRYSDAERQRARMAEILQNAKRDSLAQLRGASAELTDWNDQFRTAHAVEPHARQMIASIATAGHTRSPYEQRTVDLRTTSPDRTGGPR